MMPLAWTDELVAELRKLQPNYSAGQITAMFNAKGHPFTRNAIIGKIHRLKLPAKDKQLRPPPQIRVAGAPRKPGPEPLWVNRPKSTPPKPISDGPAATPIPFVPRVVDTGPLHLTFSELTAATCKYECTQSRTPSEFRFCGKPSQEGKPYCEAHCLVTHVKPAAYKAKWWAAA
jgi:GcrA cell cycle regulator